MLCALSFEVPTGPFERLVKSSASRAAVETSCLIQRVVCPQAAQAEHAGSMFCIERARSGAFVP